MEFFHHLIMKKEQENSSSKRNTERVRNTGEWATENGGDGQ